MKRRIITVPVLFTVLLLAGACGFQPVYKDGGSSLNIAQTPVKADLNSVSIAVIPDRAGQFLRNRLIDRFYTAGYPANPRYRLNVSHVDETIIEIGIDKDDAASRAQIRLAAPFTLTDIETGAVVLQRTPRTTTGYNILPGQFTTFITEEDARKQGLNMLAGQIVTQLELYFGRSE